MWCVRFHSWPGSLSDGWMDAGSVGTCKNVWQLFVYKYMPAVGRNYLYIHTWHTKGRGIEKNMQQGWRSWNKGGTLKARLCLGKKKRQVTTLFRTWLRRFFWIMTQKLYIWIFLLFQSCNAHRSVAEWRYFASPAMKICEAQGGRIAPLKDWDYDVGFLVFPLLVSLLLGTFEGFRGIETLHCRWFYLAQ